jgi:hypothetical protein
VVGRPTFALLAAAAALAALAATPARANFSINFETNPSLPTQPSTYAAAGAMQTYSDGVVPHAYQISGGVALGNPPFLAAFPTHGSVPNLYGTTDLADPSLVQTITLTLPSADIVTAVTGVFFNGQNTAESYVLTAMSGATVVGTATPTLAAASSTADFNNFSFTSTAALPITSVTFTTPNAATNGWNFLVDSIQITTSAAVPEPSSALLVGLGAALFLGCRRYRGRSGRKAVN